MNAIPLVCIPVLNRGDLLHRCVASLDAPVKTLLIINNGRDRTVCDEISIIIRSRPEFIENTIILSPRKNLGVGPSWNIALKQVLAENLPYVLLLGSDMQLAPGDLQQFHRAYHPKIPLQKSVHGYSLFMLTPLAVRKVGYFDENFFPAYFEDNDYSYRLKLAGLHLNDLEGINAIHGDSSAQASLTIRSDRRLFRANHVTFARNQKYYVRKWGGIVDNEKYTSPFNDASKGCQWWELDDSHLRGNDIWPEC